MSGARRLGVVAGHVEGAQSSRAARMRAAATAGSAPAADTAQLSQGDMVPTPSPATQVPAVLVTHPLDPLTPEEIKKAADAVRSHAGAPMRFDAVDLLEPAKADLRSWRPGAPIARAARAVAFKRGELGAYNAHVDLATAAVTHWDYVPGARPMIQLEDVLSLWKAVAGSEPFVKALARRGLAPDPERLHLEPWPIGQAECMPREQVEGRAPLLVFVWERLDAADNHYAHPLEGLHAVFDRLSGEFLEVHDSSAVVPVPKDPVNYHAAAHAHNFDASVFKPLVISQPEGPSFALDNRLLSWQKWQMHIGFSYREGIVLSDICFGGRPVCHSARIAEMVVPYGGPDTPHAQKSVFDIGEVGFGCNANSLQLGCDCKGAIAYLDAWIPTSSGKSRCIKNAVCIHEEDHGMLWKHTDHRGVAEVRRARRIVVSSVHTVGNYEYACYWYFMMDGTWEFEMKATGIINTVGARPSNEKHGQEVAPGVWGLIHQHLFTARLDLAIDGDHNTVVECDTMRDPMGSPDNPLGNAFYLKETPLVSELQGGRCRNDETFRFWKFVNPGKLNAMGQPTGYKLEPKNSVSPAAWPESEVGKRMAIYYKDLWVSAYSRDERYPAGDFMHQSNGQEGLPRWTRADRPIENTDIVAWYNFGLHHVTRLEDFPVQPVVSTGFMLHPVGFFDRNPCLDVPPETDVHSTECH